MTHQCKFPEYPRPNAAGLLWRCPSCMTWWSTYWTRHGGGYGNGGGGVSPWFLGFRRVRPWHRALRQRIERSGKSEIRAGAKPMPPPGGGGVGRRSARA